MTSLHQHCKYPRYRKNSKKNIMVHKSVTLPTFYLYQPTQPTKNTETQKTQGFILFLEHRYPFSSIHLSSSHCYKGHIPTPAAAVYDKGRGRELPLGAAIARGPAKQKKQKTLRYHKSHRDASLHKTLRYHKRLCPPMLGPRGPSHLPP